MGGVSKQIKDAIRDRLSHEYCSDSDVKLYLDLMADDDAGPTDSLIACIQAMAKSKAKLMEMAAQFAVESDKDELPLTRTVSTENPAAAFIQTKIWNALTGLNARDAIELMVAFSSGLLVHLPASITQIHQSIDRLTTESRSIVKGRIDSV